jgi:exopolysaccharide biosynthesis predicted pyruvyltransferase EpsI
MTYYSENKAERKAYGQKYYSDHKEEVNARNRVYAHAHPEINRNKRRKKSAVSVRKSFTSCSMHKTINVPFAVYQLPTIDPRIPITTMLPGGRVGYCVPGVI